MSLRMLYLLADINEKIISGDFWNQLAPGSIQEMQGYLTNLQSILLD